MNFSIKKKMFLCVISIYICFASLSANAAVEDIVFGDVFDSHGSVMLLIDVDSGRIVEANSTAVDFYVYSYKELTAMTIQDINILSAEETKAERLLAESEERNYFNFEHELASGGIRNVEVYSYPIEENGRILLFSIIHDVTEKTVLENALERRKKNMYMLGTIFIIIQAAIIIILKRSLSENKRIQKELFESREKYRSLFDNMQEGFALHEIVTDRGGKPVDYSYLEVNKAFMESTGLGDVRGKTIKEVLPETESIWIDKF
ncbi:MAG TPA: PAS domain S-box protein, partial [Clostridia bacterium]|nr:PAS domain S-box protein [Clostridia bacterium]